MRDYAGLVNDLRCHAGTCEYKETECSRYNKRFDDTDYTTCSEELCDDAADAIEDLLDKVESSENRHVVESEMIDEMYAENERLKNKVPKWISVEDRLPELNQEVFVYAVGQTDGFFGDNVITKCKRYIFKPFPSSEGFENWSSPWQYFHTDYRITHWMPLPAQPKEGLNKNVE